MLFQFHIQLNDDDYYEFNKFCALRSHYAKRQLLFARIIIGVICAVAVFAVLLNRGFTGRAWLYTIPSWVLLIVFQGGLNHFMARGIKSQLKRKSKLGKPAYSPDAQMEFFDDHFTEITPEEKTEQTYAAIERISVVGQKAVILHKDSVRAYILPMSVFAGEEQYRQFMDFIKTKCAVIDTYA